MTSFFITYCLLNTSQTVTSGFTLDFNWACFIFHFHTSNDQTSFHLVLYFHSKFIYVSIFRAGSYFHLSIYRDIELIRGASTWFLSVFLSSSECFPTSIVFSCCTHADSFTAVIKVIFCPYPSSFSTNDSFHIMSPSFYHLEPKASQHPATLQV